MKHRIVRPQRWWHTTQPEHMDFFVASEWVSISR